MEFAVKSKTTNYRKGWKTKKYLKINEKKTKYRTDRTRNIYI